MDFIVQMKLPICLFGFEVKVSSPGKAILREVARVRLRPAMVPEIGPRPWQVLVVLLRHAEAGPDSGDMREISVAGVRKGLKKGQHKEVSLGPKIGQLIFKILVFHQPGISGFVHLMSLLSHKMVTNMIHIRVLSHLIYESWTRTQAERPMTDNTEPTTNMLNYHKQSEMEMLVGTSQDMPLLLQAPWDLWVSKFWPWQISATLQEGTYLGVLPVKQLSTIQPPSQAMLNSAPGFCLRIVYPKIPRFRSLIFFKITFWHTA